MVLIVREVTSKDKSFNELLDVFIKKYEHNANHSANQSITLIGWVVALFIAYLSWNIGPIKEISSTFVAGTWETKIVIGSVIFTTMYISFKVTTRITRVPSVENFIFKVFKINDVRSLERTLNLLYLAKLEPKSWLVKINVDEEKGVLEIADIRKILSEKVHK